MRFTVVLAPDPNLPGYYVSCPAMPGAVSQGGTREETLANIVEAMSGWLEVAIENGFDALPETPELVAAKIAMILEHRAEEGWPMIIETAQVDILVAVAA